MNFHVGKNMITWCRSFNGIRQIAWSCSHSIQGEHIGNLRKKMYHFEISWHRHVYKRYDNVDTNLWLNLPPIWCQGKAGMKITDVWHTSDWRLTSYDSSWLRFLLRVTHNYRDYFVYCVTICHYLQLLTGLNVDLHHRRQAASAHQARTVTKPESFFQVDNQVDLPVTINLALWIWGRRLPQTSIIGSSLL